MRHFALTAPAILALALAGTGLPPLTAAAADQERCEVRREVDQQLDAAGLTGVLVDAGAGSLEVVGVGAPRVRVRGVLCVSDDELAERSRLIVERRQDAAWIETDLAEAGGWGSYARMDLTIEMPATLAADIRDGSGEIRVRSIAAVRIEDGSGEVDVQEIGGEVRIDDGSGEIRVRSVGSVELEDGSGAMAIAEVRGDVLVLEDGSGEIDIRDVDGDVVIRDDGSGSIEVTRVGGDFILEDDGSGSVRYSEVQGQVTVPPDR